MEQVKVFYDREGNIAKPINIQAVRNKSVILCFYEMFI
jgi:hypothetical protein